MSYSQEIYDAARSRISGGDTHSAIENAVREAFSGADHMINCVAQEYIAAAYEQQRPSTLLKPQLTVDGNEWCALYGGNLQEGVAGFGVTPAAAMDDFDKNFRTQTATPREPFTALPDSGGTDKLDE
ncbi:hypothetical protein IWQ55_000272 [Labrenzia sp. EL_208]|nr:hypothetical protein [Labrenzia sp. EL_132]MBG6227080.1 hypothetical protein [Labrenzia sp. EL_208]